MGSKLVVVGAGIVGASLAYHLASRGQEVTLLDAGLPGSGVTRSSFAWIGRPATSELPSAPLRHLALDEYRRLEQQLPGLPIRWSGALTWGPVAGQGGGVSVADARSVEPNLVDPPAGAVHRTEDGGLDPIGVTDRLVAAAVDHGARLMVGCAATSVTRRGDAVTGVQTAQGHLPADTVVLAAGTGTVALCAGLGLTPEVAASPSVLVRLSAAPGLIRGIVARPDLEVRQLPDGTVLAATEYRGETSQASLDLAARATRRRLVESFSTDGPVEVVSAEVGWRPMPHDGEPIIGYETGIQGLYLSVMHSAVTLAAAVGRLAAGELITGRELPELAGCRRARFG